MTERKLRVTRAARADLESIRRRTIDTWGRNRWLRYYGGMEETFARLRAEPRTGRERTALASGLRSTLYGSHVIFYYETRRRELVVLRVLHQRQNADALNWADAIER